MPPPPHRRVPVSRGAGAASRASDDAVVVEEPLEIRVAGDTVAVTMRTPGHDRELAVGFLFGEGIVRSRGDVGAVMRCGRPAEEGFGNVIEVTPAPGARLDLGDRDAPFARRGTITAACGVCGRRSIDDLLARIRRNEDDAPVPVSVLHAAARALRERQPIFAETGGCHGASLVAFDGAHVATFEDVGRHNAVDKLVGAQLLADRVPLARHVLVVSGRTSFEIVQKAACAGVPVVCGVGAATSLAVETAERAGITLVGFVRGDARVVYSGAARLVP